MRARHALVLLAASAAACTRADSGASQPPATPHYLADVARYPRSAVVDSSTTSDVDHLSLTADVPVDSVAAFYRRRLPASGWSILADTGDTLAVALYAQREGQPLWIRVSRIGPLASQYTLIAGGKPDTAGRGGAAGLPR
jgi:hypothetical protein